MVELSIVRWTIFQETSRQAGLEKLWRPLLSCIGSDQEEVGPCNLGLSMGVGVLVRILKMYCSLRTDEWARYMHYEGGDGGSGINASNCYGVDAAEPSSQKPLSVYPWAILEDLRCKLQVAEVVRASTPARAMEVMGMEAQARGAPWSR